MQSFNLEGFLEFVSSVLKGKEGLPAELRAKIVSLIIHYVHRGAVSRISDSMTGFSRDLVLSTQMDKVYIVGARIYRWLEEGYFADSSIYGNKIDIKISVGVFIELFKNNLRDIGSNVESFSVKDGILSLINTLNSGQFYFVTIDKIEDGDKYLQAAVDSSVLVERILPILSVLGNLTQNDFKVLRIRDHKRPYLLTWIDTGNYFSNLIKVALKDLDIKIQ